MALVPVNVMDRARTGARQFSKGFTTGQKAVTIAAIAAALIAGIYLMSRSGKPSYAPLYTDLSASDAASITSKLSSDKIPYKLTDGGATIEVPASDVDKERVTLAESGLPASSTVGLSLLDKEGITTSNLTQQADYLQALQGELEQTIDSISGVSTSQVNIAMPANESFSLTADDPTGASVLVTMDQGQTLSDGEVEAIVHLVASSVPNLNEDEVTVADSAGDLLAGPGVAEGAAGSSGETDSYDEATEAKINAYLDSIVGAGNADVQVNATLDYDNVTTTYNEIMKGTNGQPDSFCTTQQSTDEKYTGTGVPSSGGTAGTITYTSGTGTGTYTNTSTDNDCETSTENQTVDQAPGTLKDQSVAVLVNSRAIPSGVNLAALRSGVAAAAGISTSRGDTLAFSSMPFNNTAAKQAAAAAKAAAAANKKKAMSQLIREGVIAVVILAVLFLLWRSARKARVKPQVINPEELDALRMNRELANTEVIDALPPIPEIQHSHEALTISHFVDNQPDEVAAMLRSWLQENPDRQAQPQ